MPQRPPKHKPIRQRLSDPRPSSVARGYDGDWRAFRAGYLKRHPLCEACLRDNRLTPAEHVDHVVSLASGGERFDEENLEALCQPCHSRKTVKHDGGFGRARQA